MPRPTSAPSVLVAGRCVAPNNYSLIHIFDGGARSETFSKVLHCSFAKVSPHPQLLASCQAHSMKSIICVASDPRKSTSYKDDKKNEREKEKNIYHLIRRFRKLYVGRRWCVQWHGRKKKVTLFALTLDS